MLGFWADPFLFSDKIYRKNATLTFAMTTNIPRRLAQIFLLLVSLSYLWVCPHSKVEESFSLQATHDLFYHGVTPALWSTWLGTSGGMTTGMLSPLPYDHLQYPGVVPRSFFGPLLLAMSCQMVRLVFLPFVGDIAERPLVVQFVSRFLLFFFLHGWFRLATSLDQRTKQCQAGTWMLLITAVQFHLPYYGSRMLPNVFATILCLHAFSAWITDRITQAAILIVATTAIFRCDVILLLFTAGLSWIFFEQKLSILQALKVGVATGVGVLALTVPLDSILWQRPVWPEGEVLFFNTILNKSSEWGVSPWHFYLSSSLPKAMVLTLPLVPLAILRIPEKTIAFVQNRILGNRPESGATTGSSLGWVDLQWAPTLLPAVGYVFLYSFLGHKETRFLFPIMPLFNVAAGLGLDRILFVALPPNTKDKKKKRSLFGVLVLLTCVGALVLTWISSLCFVAVSHSNYPGGNALNQLSAHVARRATMPATLHRKQPIRVNVYIDVASAMSGISLFGQQAALKEGRRVGVEWIFEKAGYEEDNSVGSSSLAGFTHLLTEDENLSDDGSFRKVLGIPGRPWIDWKRARIQTSETIFVVERVDWLVNLEETIQGGMMK